MQLKPGHRVLVISAPGRAEDLIGPLPEGASMVSEGRPTP
jgi:hypothetical protein